MTLARSMETMHPMLPRTLRITLCIALLAITGCAQMSNLKSKPGNAPSGTSSTAPATHDHDAADDNESLSLSAISNTYFLHGRYTEGEQQLRQYLAKYPTDRSAQTLLRQLTVDPNSALGKQSRSYVVVAGDSYSTLAARSLGDSSFFLLLARYNGSTNPSSLHAGDTIRLPQSTLRASWAAEPAPAKTAAPSRGTAPTAAVASTDAAPAGESPAAKAQRLQQESVALSQQGKNAQALTRLDQALTIDPHLKPAGNQALREQLLGSYHERAVVLYRDQKLDQAIALWDRVLAIDPSYERAVIYRARAVELQHRLKQL
ncbi:LysM peptidoglycan-binding domain-containing protein [Dyella japonica]|uniref:Peptidoglycan-binding protein n=1 Tax=Dyella japonica DSM 16301 TaxID=1440762 RepID=A0A0G9GXM0_9GAMM|nr:LysM domain-containing protein [Dyella japonica]KLD62300.1 peptidoglycan-binding protein [Dyella japonica DSM 16301]